MLSILARGIVGIVSIVGRSRYVAFQVCHAPLEAPDEYIGRYPEDWREDRRWYAGMVSYWDEAVGNITREFKTQGLWDDTLMVSAALPFL